MNRHSLSRPRSSGKLLWTGCGVVLVLSSAFCFAPRVSAEEAVGYVERLIDGDGGDFGDGGGAGGTLCDACQVGTMNVGDSVQGMLESADCQLTGRGPFDVWRLEVTAPGAYEVRMVSESFDSLLFVDDLLCDRTTPLVNDDCPGTNGACLTIFFSSGSFFILAASTTAGTSGSYDLQVTAPDCRVAAATCGEPVVGTLALGDCSFANGTFLDLVPLDLDRGQLVTFDLGSGDFDPIFQLRTEVGGFLASDGDCGESASNPRGLAAVNDEIFVSDLFASRIDVYSRASALLRTLLLPYPVTALGGDGAGNRLFAVTFNGSMDIVELDPAEGGEINRFPAPDQSAIEQDALAFDGSSLFFLNGAASDNLFELDPDTGAVLDSDFIIAGSGNYSGLGAVGGSVYILDFVNEDIHIFDPATDTVTGVLDVNGVNNTADFTVNLFGSLSAITSPNVLLGTGATVDFGVTFSPQLIEIDLEDGTIVSTASVAQPATDTDSCYTDFLNPGQYLVAVNSAGPGEGSYTLDISCTDTCLDCNVGPVECSTPVEGSLSDADCLHVADSRVETWTLDLPQTSDVDINVASTDFNTVVSVHDDVCRFRFLNFNCEEGTTDSCLTSLRLEAGSYSIGVSTTFAHEAGDYTLTVDCTSVAPASTQRPGDCNQDGDVNIADGICLLGFLFLGNPSELPCDDGNATDPGNLVLLNSDGIGGINLTDAVIIFGFLFQGGPSHAEGTDCKPVAGCANVCDS